jgi:hypothetical protein
MMSRDPVWMQSAMVRHLVEELRGQGKVPAAAGQDALLATSSRHFVPPRFHGALNALA